MAGRNDSGRGDWRVFDHGDPEIDEMWRRMLPGGALRRHASLGGAIPPEDADYVPNEYLNAGRIPDSWFICQDILAVSEDGTLLE